MLTCVSADVSRRRPSQSASDRGRRDVVARRRDARRPPRMANASTRTATSAPAITNSRGNSNPTPLSSSEPSWVCTCAPAATAATTAIVSGRSTLSQRLARSAVAGSMRHAVNTATMKTTRAATGRHAIARRRAVAAV
jgi:hypothetical protein